MRGTAKEQTEIDNEREIVATAAIQAMNQNKKGNITQIGLQENLPDNTEVTDNGDSLIVAFIDSGRHYEVDYDGNVEKVDIIIDEHPGNIAIGIDGKELTGLTEESAYEIWCIEDLIEFSQNYSKYKSSYIKLSKTLDFTSNLSYTDGKMLNCNSIEELKKLLTDISGSGFTPIASFAGTFDGQGNEIKNIYQNREGNIGVFAQVTDATIKNLTVSGTLNSTNYTGGGICATGKDTIIINCTNKANIKESGKINSENPSVGGIVGKVLGNSNLKIINCHNEGNIVGDSQTGGIVGSMVGNIINCYNIGEVTGNLGANYGAVGGIAGYIQNGGIYNCYNIGKVTSWNTSKGGYASAGGILGNSGQTASSVTVANVYNIGEVFGMTSTTNKILAGAIVGGYWYNSSNICTTKNTYFLGNSEILGYGTISDKIDGITECTKEFIYSDNLVTKLNEYIETNEEGIDKSEWKTWKKSEKGYPVLSE